MSRPIQKEWIHEPNRVSTVYREGVASFIDLAQKKYEGFTTCPCPCVTCWNGKRLVFDEVRRHIIQNGFDLTYTIWSLHGEKQSKYPVVDIVEDENIEDRGLGLENLVDACYGVHEGVRGDVYGGDIDQTSNFEQPFVPEPDLGKKYAEYKSKAEEKLYPSCEGPVTTLFAVVELHDLKKQYGWSGNSVSALLSMLRTWLPKENTLPEKWPVMKKMLTDLGMKAKRINACKILKNCESEQEAISSCPTGFDPIHWEAFAIHENRQEVKDMCAKNAENRTNPEKKHRRTDSWKYGHKHRDGTVLERAQEYYDRVTSVEEQMVEEASEHGGEAVYDITCDPLAQFLGRIKEESSSKSKLEDELAEVKSTVGNLLAGQTRMENMMEGILEHVRLNGSANGQPSTPTTEVDSNSVPVHVPHTQQAPNLINRNGSLNPPSRLTSYPNVKILGRKREHVANGYVKTDSQKCHFRDIMGDEKVVYITNVLVGDAPVSSANDLDLRNVCLIDCGPGFKVANNLEVFLGSEFHVAFEEAMKYGGKVILGDRPVSLQHAFPSNVFTKPRGS
ncbi:hypothetical protein IFM89_015849 [Coptis chinensis]|uniref:Transposase-associated domain-containing protein n=1 Tax=Coptis chinensis TaxID=261450 RepID=A0A835IQV7_9MAGN|nr:hypothetical protein IFM89_015849 [Coptis chinensis]